MLSYSTLHTISNQPFPQPDLRHYISLMLPILNLLPFFLLTNHYSVIPKISDAIIGRNGQSALCRRWDANSVKTSLRSYSGVEANVNVNVNVNVDDDHLCGTIPERAVFDIYARFSPLIGGPPLLPIHVEIMLFQHDATDTGGVNESVIENNVIENDDINRMILHRMDFVPDDATNPETIGKLIGLQNVKGVVRHRTFVSGHGRGNEYENENEDAQITSDSSIGNNSSSSIKDGIVVREVSKERIKSLMASAASLDLSSPKLNLVLPLGSISVAVSDTTCTYTIGDTDASCDDQSCHSARCPTSVVKLLRDKRQMELNLVSNNCYNFAYDLMECLREEE